MIPAIILLATGLWGLIHSWMASEGAKGAARRSFGPESDRYYRLFFNVFSIVSLFPVLFLPLLLPDQRLYIVPNPWRLLFLALQVLAVLTVAVGVKETGAASFLGLSQIFGKQPPDHTLVTSGLYRWVRHPLYSAGIVFLWASPVMTRDLFTLFLSLTVYLIIGAMFEERKLLREYGPIYISYREQTPMLIPGLKGKPRG